MKIIWATCVDHTSRPWQFKEYIVEMPWCRRQEYGWRLQIKVFLKNLDNVCKLISQECIRFGVFGCQLSEGPKGLWVSYVIILFHYRTRTCLENLQNQQNTLTVKSSLVWDGEAKARLLNSLSTHGKTLPSLSSSRPLDHLKMCLRILFEMHRNKK